MAEQRPPRSRRKIEPRRLAEATPPDMLVIGRIARPWGLWGDLKVIVETDLPDRFETLRRVYLGGAIYRVRQAKVEGSFVRLALQGVTTREAAEELRDRLIEIPQSEAAPLPEGQYYHFQIVGLRAVTEAGDELGTVAEVLPTGANDVYVVRGDQGEILIPAIGDVVQAIDLEAGTLTVTPVEGLVPEARPPKSVRRPAYRRRKPIAGPAQPEPPARGDA
ncbi:MAG TPA: ribosome maturation factor RimM [Dehalococcoidia bacterium]|nr:ribosome maturation factor RimM [Dehalococcoidia bacterium]